MASMNNKERAQYYFEQLLKANNKKAELARILDDLNSLVFASSNKPIDSDTKIKILEELEQLVKRTPGLESRNESRSYDSFRKSTQASDNSDILDVISAMKKRVG